MEQTDSPPDISGGNVRFVRGRKMYLYQLTRFLTRKVLRPAPDPSPGEPHWHYDRARGVWVEPHMERHAA
ncbi:MAG: hypothetical protein J2P43_04550 [Candidatus Dormibacteraeota bacterium]|nr:hypothetical protein [Candidatus Dormibacteraeota bacterium]